MSFDVRASIRSLQANARAGAGLPFVVEYDGELAGQLNVSSIAYGSLSSAAIGYWVAERFAGEVDHADGGGAGGGLLLLPGGTAPDGDLHPAGERREPAGGGEVGLPLRGAASPVHPHQRGLARPFLLRPRRRRAARRRAAALARREGAGRGRSGAARRHCRRRHARNTPGLIARFSPALSYR